MLILANGICRPLPNRTATHLAHDHWHHPFATNGSSPLRAPFPVPIWEQQIIWVITSTQRHYRPRNSPTHSLFQSREVDCIVLSSAGNGTVCAPCTECCIVKRRHACTHTHEYSFIGFWSEHCYFCWGEESYHEQMGSFSFLCVAPGSSVFTIPLLCFLLKWGWCVVVQ